MKTLPFSKEQIQDIVAEIPTPFHLYDERAIVENMKRMNAAFSWNKGFREYFAVKATPNPELIRLLANEGAGVDCSSLTELMIADAMGLRSEDIMFSSNATPAKEYDYARKLGAIINLDDITHIDFLARHGGIPEDICLRFNPGGDFKIGTAIMGNPGDAKYGFTRPQLSKGLLRLREKGVRRFGLHAFLASNTAGNDYYPTLARLLFETIIELANETGLTPWFVNLSGGIGIPYHPDQQAVDIAEVGRLVKHEYENTITKAGIDIEVKTELGRYMTGPFGYLVTTAIHEKHTHKEYIGLDACAANLMRPAMYGAYHHISVMGKESLPMDHVYDVTGALCENNDKFAIDRALPEIEIGDIVVIHDTGAHGHSMGYNYNGRLRSAEVLLKSDGGVRLIRRAETPSDYFATLDVTGINFPNPE